MNDKYTNILILNLRKIGDTIMATSAAYLLKRAYPMAKISMLVKPLTTSIVKNNPVIDEVLLYNYSHKAKWAEIKQTAKIMQQKKFDLAVIIDNKPRSAMLAWLAKIPQRTGFEKISFRNIYLKLFYTKIYKIDYDFMAVQQVKNHEIFINRITGKNDTAKMVLPDIEENNKNKIEHLMAVMPKDKLKIALCLKSGVSFKDWPQKNFSRITEKLHQLYNASFFVVGSSGDRGYAQKFISDTKADIYDFCGKTTLPELGYLLRQADLMISVDTGTAHIAAAAEIKQVVVFAGTSHYHWAPYSPDTYAVKSGIKCYPCDDKTRKKCTDYKCLQNISIEEVLTACQKLLK